MKRGWGWLFNFTTVISLLLCMATIALWVRSYWIADSVWTRVRGLTWVTQCDQGEFRITTGPRVRVFAVRETGPVVHRTSPPGKLLLISPTILPSHIWVWHGLGILWETAADNTRANALLNALQQELALMKRMPPTTEGASRIYEFQGRVDELTIEAASSAHTDIVAPAWFVVLITCIAPCLWLWRYWLRARKVAAGLCLVCGYDLRATPDRCPECGTTSTFFKEATR